MILINRYYFEKLKKKEERKNQETILFNLFNKKGVRFLQEGFLAALKEALPLIDYVFALSRLVTSSYGKILFFCDF